MKLELYQINAFTEKIFGGNPACVIPLKQWPSDELLLKIAKENAVPETAYFIDQGDQIHLRWFTPEIEMDLCGHATLATAHCLKTILNYPKDEMNFDSLSGRLVVTAQKGEYQMNFPARMPLASTLPENIKNALSIQPREVLQSRDYVLVYENEEEIKNLQINRQEFDKINLGIGGVIVTAKGKTVDFVSRFFTPQASILEDPVTGSAHCSLIPLWAERLNKQHMLAFQLSERFGKLNCSLLGDRVLIGGGAKTFSIGNLWTD